MALNITKYKRNIWKAEAVEYVANVIQNQIEACDTEIKWYSDRNEERIEEVKNIYEDYDINEDWTYCSNLENIEKLGEKKKLLASILKTVDKEMAF